MGKIGLVYFSPTETSKKIVKSIADEVDAMNQITIDITVNEVEKFEDCELIIFGMPVYGGRLPEIATERLQKIAENNIPAIITVIYGNRAYEDALLELNDIVSQKGYKVIAAGAFIGEHSFSNNDFPIALHRPDEKDLEKAKAFGKQIKLKFEASGSENKIIKVLGNFPYKESLNLPEAATFTLQEKCTLCSTCEKVCPTGAISLNGLVNTDAGKCILCMACVKKCPNNGRLNNTELVQKLRKMLTDNFSERKEPEVFLN